MRARGAARARDRARQRERPRHRHRRRGPRRAVPALLAPARPQDRRDRGLRAWASTSASASCAPTAAASRSRASPARARPSRFTLPLFGAAAQREPPLVAGRRRATPGRGATCGASAEALGFAVHEVADGVEAVEAAVRLRPAAVVLDRILPRLRADEVAERLRETPPPPGSRSSSWRRRRTWERERSAFPRLRAEAPRPRGPRLGARHAPQPRLGPSGC